MSVSAWPWPARTHIVRLDIAGHRATHRTRGCLTPGTLNRVTSRPSVLDHCSTFSLLVSLSLQPIIYLIYSLHNSGFKRLIDTTPFHQWPNLCLTSIPSRITSGVRSSRLTRFSSHHILFHRIRRRISSHSRRNVRSFWSFLRIRC